MNIKEFEKTIDYKFKNKKLLERTLTHSSYNREKNTRHQDNERLEFLGDAFFDAIISAELFKKMEDSTEGRLTKTRALIVCEDSLAGVARKIGVGRHILMGHGEELTGGRERNSTLADAMEAVIGAIYLDGGYKAARDFVLRKFDDIINEAVEGRLFSDYKSEIQEVLQKSGHNKPIVYEIDREEGPDHDKTFFVHLSYNGRILGKGKGKSKKEAEQSAAKTALDTVKRSGTDVL